VGNVRALAVEGVLAARPDLVLATERVGPPAALDRLRDAGVRVEVLAGPKDLAAAHARTRALGRLLGASAAAESLVAAIDGALTAVPRTGAAAAVAFVYARGAGTLLVGGTGTAPAALVALAGGKNAVTAWEGFKPLTPEALVGAAPEVFLMTASGLASLGGVDGLLAAPGVALTPAGRARAVVTLDDLAVLDLGPDVAETVTQLARALEGVR
jgi:iron complex transport system substrate-binding protein